MRKQDNRQIPDGGSISGRSRWPVLIGLAAAALVLCAVGIFAALFAVRQKEPDYAEVPADIADSFPLEAESVGENPQLAASDGPRAVIHTTAGDITVLLYPDQAPKAVENFIGLAKSGYYDGSSFFYAKRDELAQTGRPAALDDYLDTEAAAKGEEPPEEAQEKSFRGEPFEDEFDDGLHHFPGAVAMAGDGTDRNFSQFYLLVKEEKPEDDRVVYANLYMNELIRLRNGELNERGKAETLSEDDVRKFEEDLNAEIQAIADDGVPEEYRGRYAPALARYKEVGGAWSLDYKHTVFGQITEGLNVARAITQVRVDAATRKPKKDVVIENIEILE